MAYLVFNTPAQHETDFVAVRTDALDQCGLVGRGKEAEEGSRNGQVATCPLREPSSASLPRPTRPH